MATFIYARVSKADRDSRGHQQTVDNQIHHIATTTPDCFMSVCDQGVSGTVHPLKRAGFSRLFSLAKRGDTIVIVGYDRLSRSTVDFLTMLDALNSKGVRLVSLRENIDTATAQGYLMATQFMSWAKYERDLISERTVTALKQRKASGVELGRKTTGDKAKAAQMLSEGCAVAHIVSQTGVSRATVFRMKKEIIGQEAA
ncbi:recombinase family protein [Pantoea dispersa]|uniref:recombinase family protein n=1 Tax=Pantoea dispersa TaxID=59814 RepID=UPI0024AEB581|nr:recombinase family protein [Pantoea dispersa]MDI6637118.1 recombinase family protein [Pantoea dispersa]